MRIPIIVIALAFLWYSHIGSQNAQSLYAEVCDLVYEKIYLPKNEISKWHDSCVARSQQIRPIQKIEDLLTDIQNQMSALDVSHLNIYNDEESRRIWQGEFHETGITSEFLDGDLIIFKVIKDSPAEHVGLKRGDIIELINGEHPSSWAARSAVGTYRIHRLDPSSTFDVQMKVESVRDDQSIILEAVTEQTGVIHVPSFRSEFFEKGNWQEVIEKIKTFKKIVVDLRGNEGGNFVAGMRFLSPFICTQKEIGYLIKPRWTKGAEGEFQDNEEDESQIQVLDSSSLVHLKTFSDYGCYTGSIVVLIDSGTASTAELVAQALKDYMGAKVLGNASSGQLLVGVWYPFPDLSPGVRISIPEAVYQTKKGYIIERNGVLPDKILYYSQRELAADQDSWIQSAIDTY